MSYTGEGQASARLGRAGAHPPMSLGATTVTLLAPAALTEGRYSLYRLDLAPAAGGADPHFHRTFAESFHVLDGAVELYDGRQWVDGHPGDHLYIPPGGIHGFRNASAQPAALIMLTTPAAPREDYFAELAAFVAGAPRPADAEWATFLARHDQYMV